MDRITIRDLRNNGREVVDRVVAGESLVVTRSGRPVAELRPLSREPLDATTLLARWRTLPTIDAERFRRDVDEAMDPSLLKRGRERPDGR